MSMPFRFADSEKAVMTFPFVGHIQPRLSSSISGTRAESGLATTAGAALAAGGGGATAGALGSAAATAGAGSRAAESLSCASAWSEYGTLTALGSVLKVALLGRPLGTGDGTRVSPALGVTGGAVTSGAVVTPPSAPPGAASTSTCPTRITFTFSMLFHAARSL